MVAFDELKEVLEKDMGFVVEEQRRTETYYGTTHMMGGAMAGGHAGDGHADDDDGDLELTMRPDVYMPVFFIARRRE
jgi:hypothetical protein